MLKLTTEIEGKRTYFGEACKVFKDHGFMFCSNWDYHKGKFDMILYREGGETIYLRVPFSVLEGELDRPKAFIQFRQPYVIKHVVNLGLDYDENSLLTVGGLNQFQKPLDPDGHIGDKSRWRQAGEEQVNEVVQSMLQMQMIS